MRAAVITNPHSTRNRRRLARVRDALDGRVLHRVCESSDALPEILAELAGAGVGLLGINGGDGTAHNVLTHLARTTEAANAPTLALIPGGSTNMSARDVNRGTLGHDRAMAAFLAAAASPAAATAREVIRVRDGERVPQLGFIFGMGAVIRGIEYCHERIYALGIKDEWVTGVALVRAAWGIARRERVFSEGVALDARLDGETHRGRASIFLVSALRRLLLGIHPFWGQGPGPLDVTWVAEDARRFLRTFPALLRGEAKRLHESEGYLSRRVRAVELDADEHYTIDGEIYRPTVGRLTLDTYGPLEFVPLGGTA
jgi:diacylglycerol kinase family enzyme